LPIPIDPPSVTHRVTVNGVSSDPPFKIFTCVMLIFYIRKTRTGSDCWWDRAISFYASWETLACISRCVLMIQDSISLISSTFYDLVRDFDDLKIISWCTYEIHKYHTRRAIEVHPVICGAHLTCRLSLHLCLSEDNCTRVARWRPRKLLWATLCRMLTCSTSLHCQTSNPV